MDAVTLDGQLAFAPASGRLERAYRQPDPADEKANSAERCNGPQPALAAKSQGVQRSREDYNPNKKADPGAAGQRAALTQHKEHDGMDEVVEHGCLPYSRGPVVSEDLLQTMRPKGAQGNGKSAGKRSNSKSGPI